MVEIYQVPQGKIIIGHSDKKLSIGLLYLNGNRELERHNRPVKEELVQISGTCEMRLFDNDRFIKKVSLREGERLIIPAHQYHVHSNQTEEVSVTIWRFEGDISEIIDTIKNRYKKIL